MRGRDRLNNMLSVVISKLVIGRSTLQDAYNLQTGETAPQTVQREAAE